MIRIDMIALYNLMLTYRAKGSGEVMLLPYFFPGYNCEACIYEIPQCTKVKAMNKRYCLVIW